MDLAINWLMLYAKDVEKTCQFYQRYFGFKLQPDLGTGVLELHAASGGTHLLIHKAAKSIKTGQACIKLVFSVQDIEGFKQDAARNGLEFGVTHHADGYCFANAKDPDNNSISISSRAFRRL